MNMYYYLTPEKDICGPYSRHQIREAVACGSIGAETLCSAAGDETWTPAAQQEWYDESLLYPVVFTCPYCGTEQKEGEVTPRCPGCRRYQMTPGKNFLDAFLLSVRRIFQLKGRSGRMEYWSWLVCSNIIPVPLCILAQQFSHVVSDAYMMECMLAVISLTTVIYTCTISLIVRRLHDIGLSGKWVFVPIVGELMPVLLFLCCLLDTSSLGIELPKPMVDIAGVLMLVLLLLSQIIKLSILVLGCIDSQRGANQYGPSYKYPRA